MLQIWRQARQKWSGFTPWGWQFQPASPDSGQVAVEVGSVPSFLQRQQVGRRKRRIRHHSGWGPREGNGRGPIENHLLDNQSQADTRNIILKVGKGWLWPRSQGRAWREEQHHRSQNFVLSKVMLIRLYLMKSLGKTYLLPPIFRWTCQTQRSVSGPAVLTISIPTGFALSESQRLRMTVEEGLNIWTTDSEIVFFFDKVLHSARPKPAVLF